MKTVLCRECKQVEVSAWTQAQLCSAACAEAYQRRQQEYQQRRIEAMKDDQARLDQWRAHIARGGD